MHGHANLHQYLQVRGRKQRQGREREPQRHRDGLCPLKSSCSEKLMLYIKDSADFSSDCLLPALWFSHFFIKQHLLNGHLRGHVPTLQEVHMNIYFFSHFSCYKRHGLAFPLWLIRLIIWHSVYEGVGFIPGLTQWVKDLALLKSAV